MDLISKVHDKWISLCLSACHMDLIMFSACYMDLTMLNACLYIISPMYIASSISIQTRFFLVLKLYWLTSITFTSQQMTMLVKSYLLLIQQQAKSRKRRAMTIKMMTRIMTTNVGVRSKYCLSASANWIKKSCQLILYIYLTLSGWCEETVGI